MTGTAATKSANAKSAASETPAEKAEPDPAGTGGPTAAGAAKLIGGKITVHKLDGDGNPVRGEDGSHVTQEVPLKAEHVLSFRVSGDGNTLTVVTADGRKHVLEG